MPATKRKADASIDNPESSKRTRMDDPTSTSAAQGVASQAPGKDMPQAPARDTEPGQIATVMEEDTIDGQPPASGPRRRINKLAPSRPWPTVARADSATGPRSAHKEGKNYICITRKTNLGAYMRRCKDLILQDGYKTLHLSAMGAAIPHLVQLSVALPPILPYGPEEFHTEITTGTVKVHDEVIPEDDEADITYESRGKSTLMIIMKIGDGEYEGNDKSKSIERRKRGKQRQRQTQVPPLPL
ncbi:hypothetical protein BD626DRAFT_506600 [Schizophyllum amplum]|uniref:Uncharacterized protein n=1 Tax=Schizophyllum amplum TaxID=97359 RepID=A0A550C561_9AGAR|nr:hypothetical protein BD626DRAFT_506600 [Auriculariopsis ampla]